MAEQKRYTELEDLTDIHKTELVGSIVKISRIECGEVTKVYFDGDNIHTVFTSFHSDGYAAMIYLLKRMGFSNWTVLNCAFRPYKMNNLSLAC